LDDLAVTVGRGLPISARLVDHAEAIIAIVDLRIALEELARGLLGLIELALVDKIDDSVGVAGEFVLLLIIGTVEVALVLSSLCGAGLGSRLQRRALGLLILCEAAALVFLPTAARARIITSGLGHDEGDERCISGCLPMRHFTGCCCASMRSLPPPSGPKAAGCAGKRLEASDFPPKPRGFGLDLGERFTERLSFCCADRTCRKRRTPPSLPRPQGLPGGHDGSDLGDALRGEPGAYAPPARARRGQPPYPLAVAEVVDRAVACNTVLACPGRHVADAAGRDSRFAGIAP